MSIYPLIEQIEAAKQRRFVIDAPPMDPPTDRATVLRRARAYLDAIPPAIEGQDGDAHTFRVCCKLALGFTLDDGEALAVLGPWNATCRPPWTEGDLLAKLASARRNGHEPVGGKLGDRPGWTGAPAEDGPHAPTGDAPVSHPDDDPLTEAGAAERFARLHGDELRFDHRRHRWLVWQGQRWAPDADAAVTRIALDFARGWQRTAIDIENPRQREAAVKLAISLERRDKLTTLLAFARDLRPVADAGDRWDADPWLLGVPNGVIDLRTGILRPGRRENQITMTAAVAYDPGATCPRFEAFVSEVFGGDESVIGFVQRAIGYSLTGDTSEQCLFFCYGAGSNGKGTLLNTLRRDVLGDYGHALAFSAIEHDPRPGAASNELAALLGRRLVVSSEASEGRRLDEGRIKWITGGDPIRARFLYAESFEFLPAAKFWLAANHKPIVQDDSHGFWRRIRLIPFTRAFAIDGTLAGRLAAEAPGILAWAVRGCLDWQRDGLRAPAIVLEATQEYQRESDRLGAFADEALDVDPDAEIGARELFDHYRTWADLTRLSDRERLTATAFGRKARERFNKRTTKAGAVYTGITTRPL